MLWVTFSLIVSCIVSAVAGSSQQEAILLISSFLFILGNPGVILCRSNLAPRENTPGLTFL